MRPLILNGKLKKKVKYIFLFFFSQDFEQKSLSKLLYYILALNLKKMERHRYQVHLRSTSVLLWVVLL